MAVCGQPPVSTPMMRSARQRAGAGQELGVLAGVDVVGDGGDVVAVAQALAERVHQRRLAGADRAADADAKRAVRRDDGRHGGRIARSGSEQPRILGLVLVMLAMSAGEAAPPMSSSPPQAEWRAPRRDLAARQQGGDDPLAVGLAQGNQPDAGRDDVGGEGLQLTPCAGNGAAGRGGGRRRQRRPGGRCGPAASAARAAGQVASGRKAAPCAIVSRRRSAEGSRPPRARRARAAGIAGAAARQASASSTASFRPAPCARMPANQARAMRSLTLPSSIAHSSPWL